MFVRHTFQSTPLPFKIIDMSKRDWKWFFIGLVVTIAFPALLFELFKILEKYHG